MIKGVLLDFHGTVVEDDDAIMDAIAEQVAAGASVPVTGPDVNRAWGRKYRAVAAGPRFRTLRGARDAKPGYRDDRGRLRR